MQLRAIATRSTRQTQRVRLCKQQQKLGIHAFTHKTSGHTGTYPVIYRRGRALFLRRGHGHQRVFHHFDRCGLAAASLVVAPSTVAGFVN